MEFYKEEIKKTGFVLEYAVGKILEKCNWTVINNRYYIDDTSNVDREIDILAYKVKEIDGIRYYTALIISCKKSQEHAWAFLTRKINDIDPNIERYPLSNWTNDERLNLMINNFKNNDEIKKYFDKDFINIIYNSDKKVFAFQQLSKKNGSPQNDKAIYDSIITSIKALEFEKNSKSRKKDNKKSFYNFNIISIFDGEMIELFFEEDEITQYEINNIKYINRHFINRIDNFYRVHFIDLKVYHSLLNIITSCIYGILSSIQA
jgi:hypothetical protein